MRAYRAAEARARPADLHVGISRTSGPWAEDPTNVFAVLASRIENCSSNQVPGDSRPGRFASLRVRVTIGPSGEASSSQADGRGVSDGLRRCSATAARLVQWPSGAAGDATLVVNVDVRPPSR